MNNAWIRPDAPATINLMLHRNADYSFPLVFKESKAGPVIDLTGYSFECEFLKEEDDEPLFTVAVMEDDLENGAISVALTKVQTEDTALMPRDHFWRLWWTDTNNKRSLKISGRVRMEE